MSWTGAWIDWMCARERLPSGGKAYAKGNIVVWEYEDVVARFLGHGIVKWTHSGGIEDLIHGINHRLSR